MLKNRLKIVLITTGRNYDPALRLVRDLKELAVVNRIDCPSILILSLVSQGPQIAESLERLGAEYLLRRYSEPIIETVRKIQWRLRSNRSLPTIVIRRRAGHVAEIVIRNGLAENQLKVGPKLRKLVEYFALHARTEHTTQMLADALGVCRQSAKEYLHRLREAYDKAHAGKTVVLSGQQVFWTKRILGGHVHGVTAGFEIADEDDF